MSRAPIMMAHKARNNELCITFISIDLKCCVAILRFLFLKSISFLLQKYERFLIPQVFSLAFISYLTQFIPSFQLLSVILYAKIK